jgi:protease inhibitor Inh
VAAEAEVKDESMRHHRLLVLLGLAFAVLTAPAGAQPVPPPSEAVKSMLGGWEMSNADRDKTCIITFKLDTAGPGRALDLDKNCTTTFPNIKDVAAWTIGKDDALRLIDAKGKLIIEFNEVENGLFESAHSGDSLYFLQTVAAAEGREHTPDKMFGTWSFARANGKPICQITLMDTAADTDSFALQTKSGCDALITGFSPRAWRMDRGQFVLLSTRADVWRFEESETDTWRRIPEGRQPLLLVKQ